MTVNIEEMVSMLESGNLSQWEQLNECRCCVWRRDKLEDEKSIVKYLKDFTMNGKTLFCGTSQIKHDRVYFLSCHLTHCEWGEMCEMGQGSISEERMNSKLP